MKFNTSTVGATLKSSAEAMKPIAGLLLLVAIDYALQGLARSAKSAVAARFGTEPLRPTTVNVRDADHDEEDACPHCGSPIDDLGNAVNAHAHPHHGEPLHDQRPGVVTH